MPASARQYPTRSWAVTPVQPEGWPQVQVRSGLRIDGIDYPAPARNALPIALPGYGVVHVNEQAVPGPVSRARTKLNSLRVVITDEPNALGLPVGTEMFVAHTEITATR